MSSILICQRLISTFMRKFFLTLIHSFYVLISIPERIIFRTNHNYMAFDILNFDLLFFLQRMHLFRKISAQLSFAIKVHMLRDITGGRMENTIGIIQKSKMPLWEIDDGKGKVHSKDGY